MKPQNRLKEARKQIRIVKNEVSLDRDQHQHLMTAAKNIYDIERYLEDQEQ